MFNYQRMTDSVKALPKGAQPSPGMTEVEFEAMLCEVEEEKALLKLSDKQIMALCWPHLQTPACLRCAPRYPSP